MNQSSVFNSTNVISEHISNADLRAYCVGFDIGKYRYDHLVDYLLDVLVDFSFGYHTGILKNYDRRKLIEAAKSIYKITVNSDRKIFEEAKKKYVDEDSEYEDEIADSYLKRGEFGEIILHLILRDFIKTVPLISKIHLKDSDGITVHGFDAIHIGNCIKDSSNKSLYLGESKLYKDGESGIKALIGDIEEHFKNDFLRREFILIGKKSDNFYKIENYEDQNTKNEYEQFLKEKDFWFSELDKIQTGKGKMEDLFKSVTIPLLCTYTSKVFENNTDENTEEFKKEYETEINNLKESFDKKIEELKKSYENSGEPISTNLNVILMLFPVPSKKELVKRLHTKLFHQQNS
ncbi:DUF1837 domain-containing protein [Candidatus Peregrinibacteria bacterium]|nr:MAG: DUF1837 domain-containing protein [Candidatus Peregrinibacteria bacterium]